MSDLIPVNLNMHDPEAAAVKAFDTLINNNPWGVSNRSIQLVETIAHRNAFDTHGDLIVWTFVFKVRY